MSTLKRYHLETYSINGVAGWTWMDDDENECGEIDELEMFYPTCSVDAEIERLEKEHKHTHDSLQGALETIARHVEKRAALEAQNARLMEDKARIDFIDLSTILGCGWIFRKSTTGRGMRLHETLARESSITVREAIDSYRTALGSDE